MNASLKTKLSTIITGIVSIIPMIQTSLTHPPLTTEQVVTYGGVLAFASILFTSAKQALSAEIKTSVAKITLIVSVAIPLLAGLNELVNVLHFSDALKEHINWWTSIVAMAVNIGSRYLFPSQFQKDNTAALKSIDPAKTV